MERKASLLASCCGTWLTVHNHLAKVLARFAIFGLIRGNQVADGNYKSGYAAWLSWVKKILGKLKENTLF